MPVKVSSTRHRRLYAHVLAGDAAYNGRFFTGVTSTGIYCLPSCHARKPKPENVEFFPSAAAARTAGFRPCRKCHPDDFAQGADPVLEVIETVVAEIRSAPAEFPDARAIIRRTGFGTTRAFELFRQHYHSTPGDVLMQARVARSKELLLNSRLSLPTIANEAGFASLSTWHEQFRRKTGLTPAEYRSLPRRETFSLVLPRHYDLAGLRRALSRDHASVSERWVDAETYQIAVRLQDEPTLLTLHLAPNVVTVKMSRPHAVPAQALCAGLLGLEQDIAGFTRHIRRLGQHRLIAGREYLRISQTPSVFEGLLWAIIGQQITFRFACTLRARLFATWGEEVVPGLFAPPTAGRLARLNPQDLHPLQYSRSKADYLINAARLVASGQLPLADLSSFSATRAERALLAIRGLGPWATNYLMMRSLGFPDCLPLGDTGVRSGVEKLFQLPEKPDLREIRRLMADFSPWRSLATTHLWQFPYENPL